MGFVRVSTRVAGADNSEQVALELLAAQAVQGGSAAAPTVPDAPTGPSRTLVLSDARNLVVSDSRNVQVY